MGSRFRYSGKTEFQSTMMRAQQLNSFNDSKSTFERRPSQRFASRRSRMDRTRPNITSSASVSNVANNNNNNNNHHVNNNNSRQLKDHKNVIGTETKKQKQPLDNNSKQNISNSTSIATPNTRRENYVSLPNLNPSDDNTKQIQPIIANNHTQKNQQQTLGSKPTVAIINGSARHQMSNSKPVKPPTLPTNASFSIIQPQIKSSAPSTNNQNTNMSEIGVNINNNNNNINNNQYSATEKRSSYVESDIGMKYDHHQQIKNPRFHNNHQSTSTNSTIAAVTSLETNHSAISNIKAKPNLGNSKLSSQNSKNFKPPETQPPPPPPPKSFQEVQNVAQISMRSDQKPEPPTRKINMNRIQSDKQRQRDGDMKHPSSMPPPPPPPIRPPPRSMPNMNNSTSIINNSHINNYNNSIPNISNNNSKSEQQLDTHQQAHSNLIKSICVTEL